jgi:hypothetical protein
MYDRKDYGKRRPTPLLAVNFYRAIVGFNDVFTDW